MATYAIGDVQGCFDSLHERFLRCVASSILTATDCGSRAISSIAGRGRWKRFVLCAIWESRLSRCWAITISTSLGVACGGRQLKARRHPYAGILAAPDRDDLIAWLRRQPLLYHDAGHGVSMVHAGLPPQWTLSAAQACAATVQKTRSPRRRTSERRAAANVGRCGNDTWSAFPALWPNRRGTSSIA